MRPEEHGTTDEMLRSDGAEIAAVEAGWMPGEKKKFARLQRQATMPGRHRPSIAVVAKGERREPATNENVRPEPADAVSRNGGNGLQEIGGVPEIGSAMGQVSDWTRETHEHKVTDTRRGLLHPVQPDGNAGGGVPDDQRRSLAQGRRAEKRQRDQPAGESGRLTPCARRTICGDRFWTTP